MNMIPPLPPIRSSFSLAPLASISRVADPAPAGLILFILSPSPILLILLILLNCLLQCRKAPQFSPNLTSYLGSNSEGPRVFQKTAHSALIFFSHRILRAILLPPKYSKILEFSPTPLFLYVAENSPPHKPPIPPHLPSSRPHFGPENDRSLSRIWESKFQLSADRAKTPPHRAPAPLCPLFGSETTKKQPQNVTHLRPTHLRLFLRSPFSLGIRHGVPHTLLPPVSCPAMAGRRYFSHHFALKVQPHPLKIAGETASPVLNYGVEGLFSGSLGKGVVLQCTGRLQAAAVPESGSPEACCRCRGTKRTIPFPYLEGKKHITGGFNAPLDL